jgi:hypothetical protein
MRFDTTAGDNPISRPAADMLAVRATRAKMSRSLMAVIFLVSSGPYWEFAFFGLAVDRDTNCSSMYRQWCIFETDKHNMIYSKTLKIMRPSLRKGTDRWLRPRAMSPTRYAVY